MSSFDVLYCSALNLPTTAMGQFLIKCLTNAKLGHVWLHMSVRCTVYTVLRFCTRDMKSGLRASGNQTGVWRCWYIRQGCSGPAIRVLQNYKSHMKLSTVSSRCFQSVLRKSKHSPVNTELFCDPALFTVKSTPSQQSGYPAPTRRQSRSAETMSGPKKYHSTSLGIVILILVACFQGKSVFYLIGLSLSYFKQFKWKASRAQRRNNTTCI